VTVPDALAWTIVGLLVASWLVAWWAWKARKKARREAERVENRKRSQSTRYGQLTERFAPWMDDWPFDPEDFRPMGSPVDGVQFAEDGVYIVEIKAADSRLSQRQREIRDHVEAGRVGWLTFRVDEDQPVDLRD